MTTEIFLNVASLEHMTKQPAHRRYALFCMDTRGGSAEFDCYTKSSMGHIDDFTTYKEAKDFGVDHPHSVFIRFYPDASHSEPSDDFIEDRKNVDPDHNLD